MSKPVDLDSGLAALVRQTITWRRALPKRMGMPRAAFANPALDLMLELAWAALKRPDRPQRITELAYSAEVPLNTARRHIDALHKAGIIALSETAGDRRSRTVTFTADGWLRAVAAVQALKVGR